LLIGFFVHRQVAHATISRFEQMTTWTATQNKAPFPLEEGSLF